MQSRWSNTHLLGIVSAHSEWDVCFNKKTASVSLWVKHWSTRNPDDFGAECWSRWNAAGEIEVLEKKGKKFTRKVLAVLLPVVREKRSQSATPVMERLEQNTAPELPAPVEKPSKKIVARKSISGRAKKRK